MSVKPNLYVSIVILFSCFSTATQLFASASDIRYTKKQHRIYYIEKDGDRYSLTVHVEDNITYHKVPEREDRVYTIQQSPFDTVVNVSARLNRTYIEDVKIVNEVNKDVFLNDNYLHKITYDKLPLEANDVLEVQYTIKYDYLEYISNIWISNNDFFSELTLEFMHPDEISVEFYYWFPRGLPQMDVQRDGGKTNLTLRNIPRLRDLPFFAFNDVNGIIFLGFKENGKDIAPRSIEGYVQWYARLLEELPKLSMENVQFLRKEIESVPKEYDKVKVIYDWVKEHVLYLAVEEDYGAIIPREPIKVLKRKYGDCKDKAFLICSIAALFGIKVSPVLINTNHTYSIKGLTSHDQFDHVICSAILDGNEILFDPVSTNTPFGILPEYDCNRVALVIDKENPRQIEKTMFIPSTPNVSIELVVDIAKGPEGIGTLKIRNYNLALIKEYLKLRDDDVYIKYVQGELEATCSKIVWSGVTLRHFNDSVAVFNIKASLSNFIVQSNTKTYIPHNPFTITEEDVLERLNDTLPVYLNRNHFADFTLHIVNAEMEGTNINSIDFGNDVHGRFSSTIKKERDGTVTAYYRTMRNEKVFNNNTKRQLGDFIARLLEKKQNFYVLTKK